MNRKFVLAIILFVCFIGMLSVAFKVQMVEAVIDRVYIRADGSIDPPIAAISSADNITYTFTSDLFVQVVVERDNIVVDGSGHTLQRDGTGIGMNLTSVSNITIKNIEIKAFQYGMRLDQSANNKIFGGSIRNNWCGIWVQASSNISIVEAKIENNTYGVWIFASSNTLSGNTIKNNTDSGVVIDFDSSSNTVSRNNIVNNTRGIWLIMASDNKFYHNNFIGNTQNVHIPVSGHTNLWDDGYPFGGNYWSDHASTEYPSNGSQPYIIDADNIDHYPFQGPNGWLNVHNVDTELSYETIQKAIDAPETLDGHVIFVEEGTYYEHVVVNKSLSLIGENRDTTAINGNGTGTVVLVKSDNVIISSFTLQNGEYGIQLYYSFNCSVLNNSAHSNRCGIQLWYSSNCSIFDNKANNNEYGIVLHGSSNSILRLNSMTGNSYNFDVRYVFLEDIDASNTVNGKPIYYWVNQHNKKIPHDAGYVAAINSNNITGEDLTLTNNGQSVLFYHTTNSTIKSVTATKNWYGIQLLNSSNCFVSNNNASDNHRGIYLHHSTNNDIMNNNVFLNGEGITLSGANSNNYIAGNNISRRTSEILTGIGINLYSDSEFNTIVRNNVSDVNYGIFLDGSSWNNVIENFISPCYIASITIYLGSRNNITENVIGEKGTWSTYGVEVNGGHWNQLLCNQISRMGNGVYLRGGSSGNKIQGNDISNSGNGIYIQSLSHDNNITDNNLVNNACGIKIDGESDNNTIYHNNFRDNTQYQALCSEDSNNTWDNGYPSGGNYWSNYTGVDSDHNGIGDTEYVIDANNTDHCPLMGVFSSFNTSLGYHVNVISNSTIEDFEYFESNSTIKMSVSGEEGSGFCRICIPKALMNVSNILVRIDDGLTPILYHNYTLYDNYTHRWIYFSYPHTIHEIDIIPEFPVFLILPLFMISTLLIVIFYRRKHSM